MWVDVVIVALLLGVGAFLNQEDWRARSLARMHTAGNRCVRAARDVVTHVRPRPVRFQVQPPSTGQPTQPGGGPPAQRGSG